MTEGTYNNLPITMCWHCDRPLDAATAPGEDQGPPVEGAVSLCMYCGVVAIFSHDLVLRAPTKEELDELEKDKDFRRIYLQFAWARQYVAIQSNLMRGEREDPDR